MHPKQQLNQRRALAETFDARVDALHAQVPDAAFQAAAASDALTLLDRTVQQQWQQLQRALDAQAPPAQAAFRAARRAPAAAGDQVVDVVAREVPDGR